MSRQQYNLRNPAVKRLMKEAQELREPTEQYHAQPLEDNLFEWHFTIRGPGESDFDGGLYHGRIVLPPEYPMKPPSIILLTPNGRFEVNKKICLSISGYHPESWQPSWSIRTALLAIIGFMPTHGAGAIGSLDYTPQERKVLAKRSQGWKCPSCGDINNVLHQVTDASKETDREARELAAQISFQGEKEKKAGESSGGAAQSDVASGPAQSPATSTAGPSSPCSDTVTNVTTAAPVTASSAPQFSAPTLPPNSANSLRFPFPPFQFPPHPLANHWQTPANIPQPGTTSTARHTFPLPFVSPPFHPMFPPPHMLGGRPPVFPPGWQRPRFPAGYAPAPSMSNPPTNTTSTTANQTHSDSLKTSVSSTNSQQTRSETENSPASQPPGSGEDNSPATQETRSGADNSMASQQSGSGADNSGGSQPVTSTTETPSTSSSSLRQRHTRSQPAPPPVPVAQPVQTRRGDPLTVILSLLTLVVVVLLIRRLLMKSPVF